LRWRGIEVKIRDGKQPRRGVKANVRRERRIQQDAFESLCIVRNMLNQVCGDRTHSKIGNHISSFGSKGCEGGPLIECVRHQPDAPPRFGELNYLIEYFTLSRHWQ
jgi:hypothetical protein